MAVRADSVLLSLDQAAQAIGWDDDRRAPSGGRTNRAAALLDAILARERETGARILTRIPRDQRTTLRVTLHALREHLPELFPGQKTRMAEEGVFRSFVTRFEGRTDEHREAVETRLKAVEHDCIVTREMVHHLDEILEPPDDSEALRTGPVARSRK